MLRFVTALDVDFNCPNEIFVGEEFECSLEVIDGDGKYDVKIDLDGERNSVLKVYNEGVWKSGYYYLLGFVENEEENIKLKVSEAGDYDGVLKLRQGDKREFFEIGLKVGEGKERYVEKGHVEEDVKEIILSSAPPEIISLNENVDSELVYESKDSKIMFYLPYAFSVFLIFIIGILIWERF
jgi:hypothetical protein